MTLRATASPEGVFLHRLLAGQDHADSGLRHIDCLRTADGRLHLFCSAATRVKPQVRPPRIGSLFVEHAEEISGSMMLRLHGNGPLLLAGGAELPLAPTDAEPQLLAGLAVLLGSRTAETPDLVAEWLRYHASHHGAEAALILNRAAPDPAFAAALRQAVQPLGLTVLLVESPLPLGAVRPEGTPPPPARGRKAPDDDDPWTAPLAEPLIHEALKWRFLTGARAVLLLDCCDLLSPAERTAFDLCETTPGGVIALKGKPAYPWRVRTAGAPCFGDHICRPFDGGATISRWGIAPRRAGLTRRWRFVRISDTGPTVPVVPFWRAMAVQAPDRPVSALVSKTSLVEDADLLALATGTFAHNPIRAVTSDLKPMAEVPEQGLRTAIVTCMRNEGPFLLEWIAFHRVIGVTDFLVYTNDCTDGTDTFLALLQEKGLCQHRVNPWSVGSEGSAQFTALTVAETEPVVQAADWLIGMDVDEFINIKIGDGTLAALYDRIGDTNMISLTWRLFGDSGVVAYEDRPIIGQFDRCAPELVRKPHQAWGFKTLFRNIGIFRKFGIHRPKGLRPEHWDKIRWLNGSGKPMPIKMLKNGWRSTVDTYGYDWVQLNHYAVRSVESFLVKRERGRVNHVDRDQGRNYWFRMSHNADQDLSIQRMLPALDREMARLLADPDIAAAHAFSVGKHRDKIATLLQRPDQRELYDELTGERMRRLTRMQRFFGSMVFSVGPHVIPDEVAMNPDLPPDYLFTVDHDGEANH